MSDAIHREMRELVAEVRGMREDLRQVIMTLERINEHLTGSADGLTAERARTTARSLVALAVEFTAMGVPGEAEKCKREAERLLARADELDETR